VNTVVSRGGRRTLSVFYALMLIFLYAPIAILIVFSFNDREIVSFPWEGFTLRWFGEFAHNDELLRSIRTSVVVATGAGLLTVILGIPASIVLVRRRFFAKAAVSGVLLAPLVIPYVVFGIALLVLFNTIGLALSPLTIAVGHIVVSIPYAILTIVPRLERISVRLEEAAHDLGAGGWYAFRTITLPLLAPAVISAFIVVFTLSFDEVVIASFIGGESSTFPLYLFSQLRLPRNLPQVIAVAVVVMAASALVVIAAEVWRRISDRRLEAQMRLADPATAVGVEEVAST
jgi:spermidine/putrescine transport system permease protein